VRLAPLLVVALLAGCAGTDVRHSVTRAPADKIGAVEMFVERPEVGVRETGPEVAGLSADVAAMATEELRGALTAKGATLTATAPWRVRPQVYIAFRGMRLHDANGKSRWEPGYVEVRLELLDAGGAVRYATFSKAPVKPVATAEWFGWGAERQDIIREIVRAAAADFASRL